MSQYQIVKADVYLNNHEIYHTKDEILQAIEQNEEEINIKIVDLFGMCCGDATKLLLNPSGHSIDDVPLNKIKEKFTEIFNTDDGLEYLYKHNLKLRYLYDNFENALIV